MKKISIKYNPYMLKTDILINNIKPADNSWFNELEGKRLQEWVDILPKNIVEEINDTRFVVDFYGSDYDYSDIIEVFEDAKRRNIVEYYEIHHTPAKNMDETLAEIQKIFNEIQKNCPENLADMLQSEDINNAFKQAMDKEFEVCVIATMSAGKSTLINSLLGKKLMPSKQEACTAIITRIKDEDAMLDDCATFRAMAFDKQGKKLITHEEVTLCDMEKFNSDDRVSQVELVGNIPFVSSSEIALVLIDTPGPNNARDEKHGNVQREMLDKSSKTLVLYIMTSEFGTTDDRTVLRHVANSMKGSRIVRDRFIFVVNKLDGRDDGDATVAASLDRVRNYLSENGIEKPNVFPAAALPAINIKLLQGLVAKGMDLDDPEAFPLDTYEMSINTVEETQQITRKLNRTENLHLEKLASLPQSIKKGIEQQLNSVQENWDQKQGRKYGCMDTALIHTGIPSIEAAIRQYIEKYAKSAKIKNVVDTFMSKIEKAGIFNSYKQNISQAEESAVEIAKKIEAAKKRIEDGKDAQNFNNQIDDNLSKLNASFSKITRNNIDKFQGKLASKVLNARGVQFMPDDINQEYERLKVFAEDVIADFKYDMDTAIEENLSKRCSSMYDAYIKKISLLDFDINTNTKFEVKNILYGDLSLERLSEQALSNMTKTKQIEDGLERVENIDKAWYKPWTWFQDRYYYRKKYKNINYISAEEFAGEVLRPVEIYFRDIGESAVEHAKKESMHLVDEFIKIFQELDSQVQGVLNELQNYAKNKENNKYELDKLRQEEQWLKDTQQKMEALLQI